MWSISYVFQDLGSNRLLQQWFDAGFLNTSVATECLSFKHPPVKSHFESYGPQHLPPMMTPNFFTKEWVCIGGYYPNDLAFWGVNFCNPCCGPRKVGLNGSMDVLDTVFPNLNVTSDFPQRVICPTFFDGAKCWIFWVNTSCQQAAVG